MSGVADDHDSEQWHDSLIPELLLDELCVNRPGGGGNVTAPRAARRQGVRQYGHPQPLS
jgi:hypothetical protein